jgi:hypothetical protein
VSERNSEYERTGDRKLPEGTLDQHKVRILGLGFGRIFSMQFRNYVSEVSHLPREKTFMIVSRIDGKKRGLIHARVMACAIIITAAVGLGGCFHHEQAVTAEPMAHPPLK